MIENAQGQNYSIPGVSPEEADRFVDLAFRNNDLRDIEQRSSNPNTRVMAREVIALHDAEIGELSGLPHVETSKSKAPADLQFINLTGQDVEDRAQIGALKSLKPETTTNTQFQRPRPVQVVDPSSGRIVPYGQMRHGNHPLGGRYVSR